MRFYPEDKLKQLKETVNSKSSLWWGVHDLYSATEIIRKLIIDIETLQSEKAFLELSIETNKLEELNNEKEN